MLNKIFSNGFTQGLVKVVLSPLYFSKLLLGRFDDKKHLEKIAKDVASYGKRHEVPGRDFPVIGEKIPAHLLDTKGDWLVASDGVPLTSKIHPNELYTGYISPAVPIYMLAGAMLLALNIVLSALHLQTFSLALLAVYSFFFIRIVGFWQFVLFAITAFPFTFLSNGGSIPFAGTAQNLTSKVPFLMSLLPALYIFEFTRRYNKNYYSSLANNSLRQVSNVKAKVSEARKLQAVNASMDSSPIFEAGEALGVTAAKGDELGSDKGQTFAWSLRDFRTNVLSQGKTQVGKSSGALKPAGIFIANNRVDGEAPDSIIVSCGKRQLTRDFVEAGIVKQEHRIHPDFMNFNWIHQMASRPAVLMNEIFKAVQGKNTKNDHWSLSGKIAGECGITLHTALIDLGFGDISQASYFATMREVKLSMTEGENISNEDKDIAPLIKPLLDKKALAVTEEEKQAIDGHIAKIKADEAARRATETKLGLIDKLAKHPDFANEQSMLCRAINNYELIFAKSSEERSGVFSTLEAWIDMFTSNEKLNKWSFVKESDLILRELVRTGGRYSIELPEEEFGTAGPVITALILKFMKIYFLEDRPIDHNPEYPYFHIFMDEAHMIASESLPEDMSLLLSKRVSYKVAFQMDESMLTRFDEAYLKTLKENCHIKIIFPSSEKTLESFSNNAGFINTRTTTVEQHTTDLVATEQRKVESEWFNPNSENRAYLKSIFRNTHKKYVRGWIGSKSNSMKNAKTGAMFNGLLSDYPHTVSVQNSEKQEPLFSKADFTKYFAEPFVCVIEAKVAGVLRRDFVRVQPMNNKGERVQVSANDKIMKMIEEEVNN